MACGADRARDHRDCAAGGRSRLLSPKESGPDWGAAGSSSMTRL
jgi:hypothetical protein